MIFQHFNLLWSRSVLKNVTFPLEIAGVPSGLAKQKALELIELVGLKGREVRIRLNYQADKTKSGYCESIS